MSERDYIALSAQYQADVLSGTIDVCRWVQLACARNRKDLDRQGTADFPYRFEADAGRRICRMAEMLPHIKGPKAQIIGRDEHGRPIWNPIVLEPWQCWYLTTMFGWLHAATGLRRFRISMLLVPRKNAKSTIAAVIVLYMLTSDGEMGAECYSLATTRDQAKVVAEIAWEMAKRSPAFCEYFGVRVGAKTTYALTIPATASKFMPLSADANTLDGLNISLAVVDELHAHKTRDVWAVVDTATGARPQPFIVITTTAGVEIGGICHEKMTYLHEVLNGSACDESFFGINYTVDAEDDWRLPAIHRKANPNYEVSVGATDLESKVTAALHSPAAINNFLTKHCNIWVRSESGWMPADLWQTCHDKGLTMESLKDFPLWIGVDLGETRDPSALALLFKTGPDTYAFIPRIYMPDLVAQRSPIAELSGWVQTGDITVTPGNEADYARIQGDLLDLYRDYRVQEIDFDRKSARLMMQALRTQMEPMLGRDRAERVVLDIPQDVATMDPSMKITEALVLAKKIRHNGNAAMAWMIGNIVVERDHKQQIYPRKAGGKDSHNKIDGPVALFTALSQARQGIVTPPTYSFQVIGGR